MADITPPKYIRTVLRTLKAHGYSSCIIGGCVRDLFLGLPPRGWHVSTSASPETIVSLFPDSVPAGSKDGVFTVNIGTKSVEVIAYRSAEPDGDFRLPDSASFLGDLNTDLSRRDFTMNAIAITSENVLVDPYHGMEDLAAHIIRCVGDPEKRLEEDPIRMLRAFRFSARLGFEIEKDTYRAIVNTVPLSVGLPAERVRDEVEKILLTGSPETLFSVISCGLLDPYLSGHLSRSDGLIRISVLRKKALPRWALFSTVLLADNCISSVRGFLSSLRLDRRTIRCCSDSCAILTRTPPENRTEWKKLLKKYGVDSVECAALCWDAIYEGSFADTLRKILKTGECFSLRNLAVNGDDLTQLGFRGRQLGEMLSFLLDYVIEYPENNQRDLLLALAVSGDDS